PDFMKQFSALETAMEQAGNEIQKVSENVSQQSIAMQGSINLLLKIILGVTALFAIGLYLLTRKSVTGPMLALSNDMQRLADGETDITCTGIGRSDEIGTMAAAVEVFRQAAIAKKQMEQEAEGIRQRSEAEQIAPRRQAEEDASARLRAATSG